MLTKEQLFASLQYDDINIDKDIINKAKNNHGAALLAIGFEYDKAQEYAKAMAWYRLSAYQNNANAQNSIAILYYEGNGVIKDVDVALEYYLKAAGNSDRYAMANIGYRFCDGQGVPVDKYKALEWFIQSEKAPENVTRLNKQGVHLQSKDKALYQLIMETEDIIRSERKKSLADIQELTRLKHLNKFEISTLQKVIQERESQCELLEKTSAEREMLKRANNSLEQQLTSQTDAINAMNTASELFRGLMQSKNNEIELLQRENQRYATIETEIQQLRQTLEEYQQQIKGLLTSNNTELFVRVKTESDVKANQSRLCDTEIKKRKLSSSNDS